MHPGQVTVTAEVVRRLVGDQFPEWSGLPVATVASAGTVNALFRVGDRLVARFPLAAEYADAEREVRAAREILGRTRFPTPVPIAVGAPWSASLPRPEPAIARLVGLRIRLRQPPAVPGRVGFTGMLQV